MGIYIPGMEMPKACVFCELYESDRFWCSASRKEIDCDNYESVAHFCPLIPVPDHGRLVDADSLRSTMYHEAFETDSPMQKWDSGCWIRYKMFERAEEAAPTIIPADKEAGE